ncbi:MAG: hypothetical protein HW416_2960, partial [Chloroflexi bacterium]|nr:hypothetical protein [Chloroflexota bacterium]
HATWSGRQEDYRLAVAPSSGRLSLVSLPTAARPLPVDWIQEHPVTLLPVRTIGAINRGDAWNRLELRCSANEVSVSINGSPVAATTVRRGASTSSAFFTFGIGADLPPGDLAEARFDNLVVTRP